MPDKIDFQPERKIDFQPVDFKPDTPTPALKTKERGLLSRMASDIGEGFSSAIGDIEKYGFKKLPESIAFGASDIAGGLNKAIVAEPITSLYKTAIPESLQKIVNKGISEVMKTSPMQTVGEFMSWFGNKYPEAAKSLGAALNLTAFGPVKKGVVPVAKEAKNIAKDVSKVAGITKAPADEIKDIVKSGMEKGIRPSVAGKKTFPQYEKYMGQSQDAIKSIIANKNNLKLTTSEGEIVTGQLPKSLPQFSEAISQTKQDIFKQYDAMAKATGQQGVKIDLQQVSNELKSIINDSTLRDMKPDSVKYAQEFLQRIEQRVFYSPDEAQEAISKLNQGLKPFYQNPTMQDASKAYVDSKVASALRQSLDDAITNSTGPGYQQLKNQYGALRAIEEDVNRRAIVDARKNIKGLADFTDIYSSPEIIYGILTANPSMVAKGSLMRGVKEFIKYRNNPNRIVKGMFSNVEKLQNTPVGLQSKTGSFMQGMINKYTGGTP